MDRETEIAMTAEGSEPFKLGDWVVRPSLDVIERNGESVSLQPQSMDVLVYLARRAGEVVSNEELLAAIWPGRIVGDDAVHRRIAYLRRQLQDDARQPRYIQTVPKRGYRLIAEVDAPASVPAERTSASDSTAIAAPSEARRRLPVTTLIAILLLSIIGGLIGVYWPDVQVETAIAEAAALADLDDYRSAYAVLAPLLGRNDPRVAAILRQITRPVTIRTNPPGVPVSYRPHGASDEAWIDLGRTPIKDFALPIGTYQLRLDDRVLLHAPHPGVTLGSAGAAPRVIDMPTEAVPADMVFVPGGQYRLGAWNFMAEQDLGPFLMDRYEVTNTDFQAFVDGAGYADTSLWEPLIAASAGQLSWSVIHERFIDSTGRPGPAGWEAGRYPAGGGALPVTGVSWFEASAYLAHRGKLLPTAQHWLRAALGPMEWKYPYAAALVPRSNLAGTALEPVGLRRAAEVHGAYDLIGNAREWTAGYNRDLRIVMGGSFREPAWSYNFPSGVDPMLRGDDLGFRGIRATSGTLPIEDARIDLFDDFDAPIRRVSDETFEGMAFQYAYAQGTVRAADVAVVEEARFDSWIRRKIEIPTSRPDDPLPVYIYLPLRATEPLQSVVYLPPADSWSPGFSSNEVQLEDYQLDFIPTSGRALIWPIYSGTHERYDGFHAVSGAERAQLAIERNHRLRDEIGRLLDYLEDDPAFDGSRAALVGLSHGAMMAAVPLALEPRLRTAVLLSVGIASMNPIFANPQNDPNVFWARVTQPVLVINGRYDPIRPHQKVMDRFIDLLGTPAADKQGVLLDSGHWPLPRGQMVRLTLEWLDRHLGPVPGAAQGLRAGGMAYSTPTIVGEPAPAIERPAKE